MGILETWAKERTKRIEARNKRRTASVSARQEARGDVAEATGKRAGQSLAESFGDSSVAGAGFDPNRGSSAPTSSAPRGGMRGGNRAGQAGGGRGAKTDNTLLYVGGAVLMGLLLMGQGQKK
jgi:hypothetical protein